MGSETLITPHLITPKILSRAVVGMSSKRQVTSLALSGEVREESLHQVLLTKVYVWPQTPLSPIYTVLYPHKKPTCAGACL